MKEKKRERKKESIRRKVRKTLDRKDYMDWILKEDNHEHDEEECKEITKNIHQK